MDTKMLKGLGIACSVIGLGISLLADWTKEQQQKAEIAKQVGEAIAKLAK